MNLRPTMRVLLHNILTLAIIPGPSQPKDLDSFLVPVVDMLHKLETGSIACASWRPKSSRADGVDARDASKGGEAFTLRAVCLAVLGDTPASSKCGKWLGCNAYHPCRRCTLEGVRRQQ